MRCVQSLAPCVQNNKDYFDQSLDEVKLLRAINAADPHDAHGILRLYDFFYYRVRTSCAAPILRSCGAAGQASR